MKQLAVFIRTCDRDFHVSEELVKLVPMHDTARSQDIFQTFEQDLYDYGVDLSNLACLSTDGAPNVVGRLNGVAAKLRAKVEKECSDS